MIECSKTVGIAVSAFGLGVLAAFFMPRALLVITESAVIIAAGILFLKD